MTLSFEKTKKTALKLAFVATFFLGSVVGDQIGFARANVAYGEEIADLVDQLSQAEIDKIVIDTARQREKEVDTLARAFYSEYRAGTAADREREWLKMFSAMYNRMEYEGWWSDDFMEVLQFGCESLCEINGLPLVGEEALLSAIGQEAVAFATKMVELLHTGPFVPTHTGHSWATPAAAAADSWFQTLCQVAEGPGHLYFGDCNFAPTTSLRPVLRPAIDPIMLALMEANK